MWQRLAARHGPIPTTRNRKTKQETTNGAWSSSQQGKLHDIRIMSLKGCLAIGQVKFPGQQETAIKTLFFQRHALGQETGAPLAQGFRVIETEAKGIDHAQALRFGAAAKLGRRRQHAARENVLLDKISALAIALKQFVGDDDGLDAGASARFQITRDTLKIAGPITLPHGFKHFYRSDGVILTGAVAVIAQLQISLLSQAGCLQALARISQLFGRQGQARDKIG